ncbi:hypothetical protein A1353_03430 [Methylomonas methanica]|uniref:Uncharacterized protein n=1 Tax=Methylomonas methanica TaxID=421 RepID=A0A177MUN6_METMH|nr:hypothetical protein [Methylomonas methanica]OAI09371.1 hypothetical protein A1353_03430 [Methylomonas methanica]
MYRDLKVYLDLKEILFDESSQRLKTLHKIKEIAEQHQTELFYDRKIVEEFSELTEGDEDYITGIRSCLDLLLMNCTPVQSSSFVFKVCFSSENTSLSYLPNQLIAAMRADGKNTLLSLTYQDIGKVLLASSHTEFQIVAFEVVSGLSRMLEWIISQGPKRVFNVSQKHGENGKSNWPNESPLLCSGEEAQELLNNAIADFNEKQRRLFNYDRNRNAFIEFFYEGDTPQQQWHGFHVTSQDVSRVPLSICKHFGFERKK